MMPSFWQILIAVAILLLIFGPKRIPALGKSLGEAIRGFRKGIKDEEEKKDKVSSDSTDSTEKEAD